MAESKKSFGDTVKEFLGIATKWSKDVAVPALKKTAVAGKAAAQAAAKSWQEQKGQEKPAPAKPEEKKPEDPLNPPSSEGEK